MFNYIKMPTTTFSCLYLVFVTFCFYLRVSQDFRYSCECLQAFTQNYKLFGNTLMLTWDNLATNFSTIKHWLWNEIYILNIYVNINLCSFISFCFGEGLFWLSFWFSSVCCAVIMRRICRLCSCTQSWLPGDASDVCMAEMCNILLYSVQLMEPYSTGSWLRSGLLGSRTWEPHLLPSVDVSMQTLPGCSLSECALLSTLLLYPAEL